MKQLIFKKSVAIFRENKKICRFVRLRKLFSTAVLPFPFGNL